MPQQMLVHKGDKIKNWDGDCRDVTPTKLQSQNIHRALQVFYPQKIIIIIKKIHKYFEKKIFFSLIFLN